MASLPDTLQTALQHHQAGRLQEAEALYLQILQIQPGHPDALHLLGMIAYQVGQHQVAVEYISRAIALNPNAAEFRSSLGLTYRALGKLEEAVAQYWRALALKPDFAEAHNNLGNALQDQGKLEEAVAQYRQALALKPDYVEAYNNLGTALQGIEQREEAIAQYQRALALRPHYVQARVNLANSLLTCGCISEALKVVFSGLELQPTNVQLRFVLSEILREVTLKSAGEPERAVLLSLCQDDTISAQDLVATIISLAKNDPTFPRLLNAARAGEDLFCTAAKELNAFTREPLLLAALPRVVIVDADIEQVLTHLRRCLLLRVTLKNGLAAAEGAIPFPFVCALAQQCFNNEYAFFITGEEAQQVRALCRGLDKTLRRPVNPSEILEWSLVFVALYGQLHLLPNWERLLTPALTLWSRAFQPLLRQQLINRRREREIASTLTALTGIKDKTSRKVGRQYEENPYPRWTNVPRSQPISVESFARRFHPGEPARAYPRPVSILVAGCGTGCHPIGVALRFSECEVLAVDLSRPSLAYGARMAEQLGVTNVSFQQADILELGKLKRRFSVIECVGVLHHLRDPLAGWRVLLGLLEPAGLMKIGLYSERGRRHIQAARMFVRDQNFPATPDGIRKCRQALINLPAAHPARDVLVSKDFFSISGFRDLIMHVQEQTFTLPDIAKCLEQLKLRFLGFECGPLLMGRFTEMFPGRDARTDLMLWHRFEESCPDGFMKLYQFWCCRK
ncbi:MAG: tetratricopeptide repeat protein [Planctomycetota bacterium]